MTDVSDYREEFERCKTALNENHLTAIEDIDFALLEKQWPDTVARQREIDQRPMLTINKLPAFIRQVVNDARQNKPAIKVQPVDDNADPETAEVLSGIIRNIEAISNADVAYDTASEQAVASGFGYWRVKVDYAFDDNYDLDIIIDRMINQFAVYGDPSSTAADSSDWDVAFVTDRLSKAAFQRKYKDKANVDWDSEAWTSVAGDWLNEDGVLIAERWIREEIKTETAFLEDGRIFPMDQLQKNVDLQRALAVGEIAVRGTRPVMTKQVSYQIMSGCDVLEKKTIFPCRYIPIVPVYGSEILVQGRRLWRSLIHSAIDSQRMFNYWRSTATELVALSPRVPYIGPAEAFEEDDGWETANTKSHPYLTFKGLVAPQRQPLDVGPAAGALQEALNASDDMKSIIGMYDASLGARSNETSGRAIMARQREGDVSTFHFQDNLNRAIRHTGKILVDMIPRVYTGERIMRILGEDGTPENRKVNAPYEVQGPDGQPMTEPTGEVDEEGNEIMRAIVAMHDLETGKYDVVVKAGPSFTTRREEAVFYMTEAVRSAPATAPVLIPKIAEMSDWPGADDIAEELKALMNPNSEQLPPEVQQMIEAGKAQIDQLTKENEQLKAGAAEKEARIRLDAEKLDLESEKMRLEREIESEKVKLEAQKVATSQYEAMTGRMGAEVEVFRARKEAATPISVPQPEMQSEEDKNSEALMQGLVMIGRLIDQTAGQTNAALGEVAQAVSAPTEIIRDVNGRPIGAKKVINNAVFDAN